MSEAVIFGGYLKEFNEGIRLNRCPHCNGEARIVCVEVIDADTYEKKTLQRGAVIECKECGCMSCIEVAPYKDFSDFISCAKSASAAWNKRINYGKETM